MDIAIEESGLGSMILCRDKSTKHEAEKWFIEQSLPYVTNNGSSLFQSRYANAIRELRKAQRGEFNKFNAKHLRKDVTLDRALTMDALEAISMPPYYYDYFRNVDLDCGKPYILSTIHASKGLESDNVVLLNGMSDRVYNKLDDNEYRVWYVGVTRARKELRIVHMDNPLQILV
jgi:superfamily I DNA/RNA helicase